MVSELDISISVASSFIVFDAVLERQRMAIISFGLIAERSRNLSLTIVSEVFSFVTYEKYSMFYD